MIRFFTTQTQIQQPIKTVSKLRKVLKFTSLSVLTAAATGYGYLYATDEGTRRSAQFWIVVTPIYLHYRIVQLLNRDLKILSDEIADPYYEKLHEKYSPVCRDITYDLRGFYLKNAQLLSTQDGFIPKAYMNWLKDTQDNVPSEFINDEAKKYVTNKLKEELNLNFDDIFENWDDKPIGVASIGQVHRAILKENHKEVAVKIQFPDMERRFRADIKTIKLFCKYAMPQFTAGFNEIERQFITEFDYKGEANNLLEIKNGVEFKFKNFVVIPKPYMNLCSKHILVMEYLHGKKLVDGIRDYYKNLAKLLNTTMEELENKQKQQIIDGTFKLKNLQEENLQSEKLQQLLFYKDITSWNNITTFLYNNFTIFPYIYKKKIIENDGTINFVTGYLKYTWSEPLLNLSKLLEILGRVHAYEMFQLGAFNGDPHPGNILLLDDGRLGLIDYGKLYLYIYLIIKFYLFL